MPTDISRPALPPPGADASALVAGRVVRLAEGLRRVVAPNPGRMTGPGTNTYLVGDAAVVVIDPGPLDERHLATLEAAIGTARLAAVCVTHTHRDHSPAAAALAARRGAPMVGRLPRVADWHDPSFVPDRLVEEGTRIGSGADELIAVLTPGHASNHVCWHLPAHGLVFTGDHVLGTVSPVILHPDGDMSEYLDSLERLAALVPAARLFAPGHGPLLDDPPAVLAALIRHRLLREAKVLAALGALGPVGIDALLALVYADVDPALHAYARHSLEAHLIRLERHGRARCESGVWRAR